MCRTNLAAAFVAVGIWVSVAHGQTFRIVITGTGVGFCSPDPEYDETFSSGTAVTIDPSSCAGRVNITASTGNVNIGRITITGGPSNNPLEIIFGGSSTINQSDTLGTTVGNDWGGLNTSGMVSPARARLSGTIGGNLTGSVTVGELFRFDAFGEVRSQIRASSSGNAGAGIFVVEAGTITAAGSVLLDTGHVLRVRAKSPGSILGPVTATAGRIYDVFAPGGDIRANVFSAASIRSIDASGNIGTSTALSTIQAKGDIASISAAAMYANVTANYNQTTGNLRKLVTTSGGFTGSIAFDNLGNSVAEDLISIAGNLDANVTAVGNINVPILVSGSLPAGRTINIGARLNYGTAFNWDGRIELGTSGLVGQIIVNSLNNPVFEWLANVKVGSTTLSTIPYYSNLSSALGGGAVGLVPYHLHDEDCNPANGYVGSPPTDNALHLRWYGPLEWTTGNPVDVFYRVSPTDAWTKITSDFEINPSNPRQLDIVPITTMDFDYVQYRVIPRSNLMCGGLAPGASATVYQSDEYIVTFQ